MRWSNLGQKSFLALSLGIFFGIAMSFFLLETGFGFNQLRVGPWTAAPRLGAADLDPYSLAQLSFFQEIPLGAAEGMKFIARITSSGAALRGRCDYKVSGRLPRARLWTLNLYSSDGKPLAAEGNRPGLSSEGLLRLSGGSFEIVLARNARPGNWLPLPDTDRFCLALTLYDIEASTGLIHITPEEMPSITALRCQ